MMATAKTERTYIIPLRKAILRVPKYKRAKRAVNEMRRFLKRHLKTETVKIGKHLNEHIWHRGIRNPPTKIKVNAILDEEGVGHAELFGKPLILKKEEEKKKKDEKPKEEKPKAEKKAEEKKPKKAAPKKPKEKKLGKKALQKQLKEELKKKAASAKKKPTPKKAPAKK